MSQTNFSGFPMLYIITTNKTPWNCFNMVMPPFPMFTPESVLEPFEVWIQALTTILRYACNTLRRFPSGVPCVARCWGLSVACLFMCQVQHTDWWSFLNICWPCVYSMLEDKWPSPSFAFAGQHLRSPPQCPLPWFPACHQALHSRCFLHHLHTPPTRSHCWRSTTSTEGWVAKSTGVGTVPRPSRAMEDSSTTRDCTQAKPWSVESVSSCLSPRVTCRGMLKVSMAVKRSRSRHELAWHYLLYEMLTSWCDWYICDWWIVTLYLHALRSGITSLLTERRIVSGDIHHKLWQCKAFVRWLL